MSVCSEEILALSPATSIESLEWDTLSEPITEDFQETAGCKETNWKIQIAEMHTWLKRREQLAYNKLDPMSGWEENYLTKKAAENKTTQLEANQKLDLLNNIIALDESFSNTDIKGVWAILMLQQRLVNLLIHCVITECTLDRRLDLIQKMFCASDLKSHSTQDIWSEDVEVASLKNDFSDEDYIL